MTSRRFRSVYFYDAANAPIVGALADVSFGYYGDRLGNVRTEPTIIELGEGGYGWESSEEDEAVGVLGLVFCDTADLSNWVQVRTCALDGLLACVFLTDAGSVELVGAGLASFGSYRQADGTNLIADAPAFYNLSEPLFGVDALQVTTIPSEHLLLGISFLVDAPGPAIPETITGFATDREIVDSGSGPEVTVSPANGTELTAMQPVVVTVIDDVGLRRALMVARFPNGTDELIFDGTRFSSRYRDSSSSPTTGGVVVTVRRTGGWAAAPTIEVFAIDTSGNEAA